MHLHEAPVGSMVDLEARSLDALLTEGNAIAALLDEPERSEYLQLGAELLEHFMAFPGLGRIEELVALAARKEREGHG